MKTFPKSTEQIQDIVAALLVEGTGVTLAYNDGAGTLTISSSVDLTGYATTEYVDDEINANGASLQAFASNASNLSSGTVADARLSSNVARLNSANTGASIATTTFIVQAIASQTSPIQEWKRSDGVVGARVDTAGRVDIYSAKFHAGSGVGYSLVSVCDPNLGIAIYNAGSINWSSTGAATGTADVKILRNATGPTLETRAAGGLRVANADGSALAAVACGTINATASGTATTPSITIGNTGLVGFINQSNACVWVAGGVARGVFGGSYIGLPSTNRLAFSLSSDPLGTPDLALGRDSVGVAGLYTTFNGSTFASLNLANLTASGIIGSASGSDLTLRANTSTMLLQVSNGNFTSARLGPGVLNGPSQIGLASSNNPSVPDAFVNSVGSGVVSITSDIGKTTRGSLNLANLNSSGVAKFDGYPTSLLPAAASNAGSITYDTTLSKHVGCNGSSWNALW